MGDEILILGLCMGFTGLVVLVAFFLHFYLDNSCENDDDCDGDEICYFDSTTTTSEGVCKNRTSIGVGGGGGAVAGGVRRGNNRTRDIPCFYDLECTPTPAYCDGVDLSNLVEGKCKSGAKPSNSVSQGFVQNEQESVASRARGEEWWTSGYMSRFTGGDFSGNYINFIRRHACCNGTASVRAANSQKVPEAPGEGLSCTGDLNEVRLGGRSCGYHLKFTPHEHWQDVDATVFQ